MYGWTGNILRVNLTDEDLQKGAFSEEFAKKWVGGRGFAVKILYDELKPGIDPLGPENKFIVALGPIAGIPAPNTGKAVVAAKSPLTGFYGDGNLGTRVSEHLRKAGYDVLIVEGKADRPTLLYIEDDKVEFLPAGRGLGQGDLRHERLDLRQVRQGRRRPEHRPGRARTWPATPSSAAWKGGPAAGRASARSWAPSSSRPSSSRGRRPIPQADPGRHEGPRLRRPEEGRPDRQADRLVHPEHERRPRLVQRGRRPPRPQLPEDPSPRRLEGRRRAAQQRPDRHLRLSELHDALRHHDPRPRGPRVRARLRERRTPRPEPRDLRPRPGRLAELSLRRLRPGHDVGRLRPQLLRRRHRPRGDDGRLQVRRRRSGPRSSSAWPPTAKASSGNLLADGSLRMARAFGHGSEAYAMQVKGLEVAAYNCKFIPGQALAFGVAPIGAHHKEAWIITFELKNTTARNPTAARRRPRSSSSSASGAACSSSSSPAGSPGSSSAGTSTTIPSISTSSPASTGPWTTCGRSADRIYAMIKLHYLREIPGRDPRRRLSPGGLVRPVQRRHRRAHRRQDPGARQVRRAPPALLRPARLRPPGDPDQGDPRTARPLARRRRRPKRYGKLEMKITIKLIGPLIYAAGFSEKEMEVPQAVTVGEAPRARRDRPGPAPDRHPERQGRRSGRGVRRGRPDRHLPLVFRRMRFPPERR